MDAFVLEDAATGGKSTENGGPVWRRTDDARETAKVAIHPAAAAAGE